MAVIRVVAFDPSITNFGIVKAMVDMESGKITPEDLILIETEGQAGKDVRKSSDDLRRATVIAKTMEFHAEGAAVAISEVPSGAQSARAAFMLGSVVGVLASCPVPLIQVSPIEVKKATVGKKTASKQEMIDWAVARYPDLPWLRRKSKGEMVLVNKNEHLADAVATLHCGVQSVQFAQLRALMNSAAPRGNAFSPPPV